MSDKNEAIVETPSPVQCCPCWVTLSSPLTCVAFAWLIWANLTSSICAYICAPMLPFRPAGLPECRKTPEYTGIQWRWRRVNAVIQMLLPHLQIYGIKIQDHRARSYCYTSRPIYWSVLWMSDGGRVSWRGQSTALVNVLMRSVMPSIFHLTIFGSILTQSCVQWPVQLLFLSRLKKMFNH